MQFNFVNKLHSLSGVAWHGVVWHCMALALGFIRILGRGVPAAFLARTCIIFMWCFPWRLQAVLAVSGSWLLYSFAYYACTCACPRGFAWLSVRCVGARVLSSIFPPSSPYSGELGPLLFFPIELTVQCDWCLIWGLVWQVGLMAGLIAGRAGLWGVSPSWVWVVRTSPQILEQPTPFCDTGVKSIIMES